MPEQAPVEVVEIAVNLDDVSPEVVGQAVGALLDDGALDAWTTPIGMKKNRPGVCLSVLCGRADRDRLARRVIELTGSFGVRFRAWDRLVLDRHAETAATPLGPVRIKVGSIDGRVVAAKPEYEDAVALAKKSGLPLREVLMAAQDAVRSLLAEERGGGGAPGSGGDVS